MHFQFGLPASPQVYTKLLRMDVSSGPHGGLVLCLGLLLAPKNHQSRATLSRVRSRTRDIRTDFDVKLRSPLGTAFSRLGRPSLACVGRRNRASSRKISAICRAAMPSPTFENNGYFLQDGAVNIGRSANVRLDERI